MKLDVIRTQFGADATNGMLFIDGVFECYTLEDEYRDVKVMHETCIPEGEYEIKLRTEGGFHNRYLAKYGSNFHKGMLWIQDVPEFEWILIHTGNRDLDTAGCLLVGDSQQDLDVDNKGFIGSSVNAYKKFYPKVANAILNGDKVTIEYKKINKELSNKQSPDMIVPSFIKDDLSEIKGMIKILTAKLEGKNIT
jgi:hypothetical protein